MLEMRTNCENCNKSLPNGSKEAMICSFECTFCESCVTDVISNVCPNCGGGFHKRPSRPNYLLGKFPVSNNEIHKPVNQQKFQRLLDKYGDIDANER
jgi:hypothetical protein